jgi:NAD(P)-dependent dehydrogenase (short-subunit alcohol dehydrogenase family)
MAKIYAKENAKSRLRVNLVNPGGTRTAMRAQAMPGENPDSVKPPEAVTETFVKLAEASCDLNGETLDCR